MTVNNSIPNGEPEKKIIGKECRHAIRTVSNKFKKPYRDDFILIKEIQHWSDGSRTCSLVPIKNFKRPYWITKEKYRNHKQKKTREWESKVDLKTATQQGLVHEALKALGDPYRRCYGIKDLASDPYIYGLDITPTSLIKKKYDDQWPDAKSMAEVAILDVETDVIRGDEEIDIISITWGKRSITSVTKKWLETGEGKMSEEAFLAKAEDYCRKRIKEVLPDREVNYEVHVDNTPLDAIKRVIGWAHEHKPDIIAGWNLDYDIKCMIRDIDTYGGDKAEIFSDPSVPDEFKFFDYVRDLDKKETASGKVQSKEWFDQWHTLVAPASFYFIDQAALFRNIRFAGGKIAGGMGLDNILSKFTKLRKLKDKYNYDHLAQLKWHQVMSGKHKLEYLAYNLVDCIGCEVLDEQAKVKDLKLTLGIATRLSDYKDYMRQPKVLMNTAFHVCRRTKRVIGSTSSNVQLPIDAFVVKRKEWIVTLPAHNVARNGLTALKGFKKHRTRIWLGAYDIDVKSAYPYGQYILNASRETTVLEVVGIGDLTEKQKRRVGMLLSGGTTNAAEICQTVYKVPTFDQWCKLLEERKNARSVRDGENPT